MEITWWLGAVTHHKGLSGGNTISINKVFIYY